MNLLHNQNEHDHEKREKRELAKRHARAIHSIYTFATKYLYIEPRTSNDDDDCEQWVRAIRVKLFLREERMMLRDACV